MLSHVHWSHTAVTDDGDSNSENGSYDDDDDEPVILTVEDIPIPSNNQMTLNQANNPMHGPVAKQQGISNVTMDTTVVADKQDNVPSVARQQHRATFPQGVSFK